MSETFFIESENLSFAWRDAFLKLNQHGVKELSPAIIILKDLVDSSPNEDRQIRQLLDDQLSQLNLGNCEEVANTIFPNSMWNPNRDPSELFERYTRIWPLIKQSNRANNKGNYFSRMIAYEPNIENAKPINQLNHVIETFKKGNHRRTALQLTIFDPTRDHTHSRQAGFPCLQQVVFAAEGNDGLSITGFYPLQYAFEKAYGNYLGLSRLGKFMAHQLDRKLIRMTCFASALVLGNRNKSDFDVFVERLNKI